ncbi:LysR family transcriptional regulator [Paraburkholderia sediminicola]|uniref:LysR family transcriptional regulator n=1 Tax=Paraburkholderia sediminicola TaxID=458836 RepID=UPI0038B94112
MVDDQQSSRRLLTAVSLRQMHYFVTLCRKLNFQVAAEELALTPSALSIAIKEMERLVGAPLFVRQGHRVTMSDVGSAVRPIAEHLVNTASNAFADMARLAHEHQQTVRIGLVPSIARWAFERLSALSAQHPQLRFEFFDRPTGILVSDVEEARVDFGIGVGGAEFAARLKSFRLMTDEIVAVVRKDDPLVKQASVTWSELINCPIGHFIRGGVMDLAGGSLKSRQVVVNARYQVAFTETLYGLVRAGFCVGLVPRLTATSLMDSALTWIPVAKPRLTRDIVLLTSNLPVRHAAVTQCVDFLRSADA